MVADDLYAAQQRIYRNNLYEEAYGKYMQNVAVNHNPYRTVVRAVTELLLDKLGDINDHAIDVDAHANADSDHVEYTLVVARRGAGPVYTKTVDDYLKLFTDESIATLMLICK